jgi:Glycoside-hydrolase family GH114
VTVLAVALAVVAFAAPPVNAGFDYQIGGDYPLPPGVTVVARDWFSGAPAPEPAYSICYVNAFQTQADEARVDRPDERSNWPPGLVLGALRDDPEWDGEYLIDIGSARKRRRAAAWVRPMVEACAGKGFRAVEFDNLDSWTRFDGIPFGKRATLAYARRLVRIAHDSGLAAAQKNTPGIPRRTGFDFAIAEECARYRECRRYRRVYGRRVIAVEYRRRDFRRACRTIGDELSVVLRDRRVRTPDSPQYVFSAC